MGAEPWELTIADAGRALRDGSLTSAELTESVIARTEATEPRLNAFITRTDAHAREQAEAADLELRAGRDRGPLHGIPFALKDLYDTAGIATTGGSDFLRERVPERDAFVVTKLKQAGIVLTGKLNLHEFALGTTSNNPHFGAVRNPWDIERSPGGSSGGSGAAISAGSALGTLGSDTGGSIRIPASLCGCVGLMPTYGRTSRNGVLPLSWSLDHVGPLAKTVEDAALILNAIAGHDPADPGSASEPVDDYTSQLGRDLRGLRVGVPRDPLWLDCAPAVGAASEAALVVLRELGATVQDVELPLLGRREQLSILTAEAAAYHERGLAQQSERYGEDVRDLLELGRAVPATDYINAQRQRRLLIEETSEVLRSVDVLVSPTTPITAPPIEAGEARRELARLTGPYDVTAIPAISVPCGFDEAGLPIGLMIGGRHFDEVTVCRVAHAYEQATDWHTQRPPI
jgi:aspartyl-tRNA(Asn)/glutamyl-tRNA(Gln) amidotransferase subunit A